MNRYIAIQTDEFDCDTYPINTQAEIDEATRAMASAGLEMSPVHVGDPEDPESYANGEIFTPKLRRARRINIGDRVYGIDTPEGLRDAQVDMIAHDVAGVAIWDGDPCDSDSELSGAFLTLEHYICPGCGELRDHGEVNEAKCADCGRCPDCAPSERLGMEEYCDECMSP